MTETTRAARGGWQQEETDLLWKEVLEAADSGAPLRQVFERMGQALGRKPNSVRNYYYMQLRGRAAGDLRRAQPFETFTDEQVRSLLRQVLIARGKGQSVRACVMDMSHGDKALMLRYQNKYRSVMRKKPALIRDICEELATEGLPCPPMEERALPASPAALPPQYRDPDVQAILSAALSLARRAEAVPENDRLKVQRDLLSMQLEDVQLAARALIAECKDFLGEDPQDRPFRLAEFCEALTKEVAKLESVSG